MKKKLIIGLTIVMLVAFAVPAAFAAITDAKAKEIESKEKQILELRKQIIQDYVDAGEITAEEGTAIKERIDQNFEYKQSQGFNEPRFGKGFGRGGRGCGGAGAGAGCGNGGCVGPNASQTPTANQL